MASGVSAKVLHVDLTSRQTRVEEIPEVTVRKHLGGGALACHLLLRDMPVVQACALIFAATYILLNLSADIISIITNPRLLHPR